MASLFPFCCMKYGQRLYDIVVEAKPTMVCALIARNLRVSVAYHRSMHSAVRSHGLLVSNLQCNQRKCLPQLTGRSCLLYRSQSQSSSSKNQLIRITPQSVLVSLILSGVAVGVYLWLENTKQLRKTGSRIAALSESGLGKLNWTLTDQYGKRRTFSEFRGQWVMLYFGFCHCPDICPEELEKLVEVVKGIDANARTPDIQPVFITLDPARDTVQFMHKYCKDFSPKLIGFTGSTEEIEAVAKSYRVYYSLGEKDSDGDYIVDHTICMYLINPDGQLIDVYERRAKADGIVRGSTQHMIDYKKLKNK